MNSDIVKGKWQELKGKAKAKWGKLTDDDLTQIAGKSEEAVGRLQKQYGYTKDKAEKEWKAFCDEAERSGTAGGAQQSSSH